MALYTTEKYKLVREEDCAGYDICSIEDITIEPNSRKKVKTGIRMQIPTGSYGSIRDKSSMALKGIDVCAGVIDSSYRGEIIVLLHNSTSEPFEIKSGMKIAQIIICTHMSVDLNQCDSLSSTNRGEGGFGSTGMFYSK